jgi:putative acetyltransferase
METTQHLSLQPEDPGGAEASALLAQLDDFLNGLYPPQNNHLLSVEALRQPGVTFLTARVDGKAVGCGAVVNRGGEYAEIKRMFILPEFRGLKIAHRLLDELEQRAQASGLVLARLETGVAQPEALRLYERAGYTRREPFGAYPDDPVSVFMEKRLT